MSLAKILLYAVTVARATAPSSAPSATDYQVLFLGSVYHVQQEASDPQLRRFLDSENRLVTDEQVLRGLSVIAWVRENIQSSSGDWNPPKRIQRINDILATAGRVTAYEASQEMIVRAAVDVTILDATGGSLGVLAGLTIKGLGDALKDPHTLCRALASGTLIGARSKYEELETIARPESVLSSEDARRALRLYREAIKLDLPFEALLISLLPQHWSDLVDQGLRTAAKESLRFIPGIRVLDEGLIIPTSEAQRDVIHAAAFTRFILKFEEGVASVPALRSFAEQKRLARGLADAADSTIEHWVRASARPSPRSAGSAPAPTQPVGVPPSTATSRSTPSSVQPGQSQRINGQTLPPATPSRSPAESTALVNLMVSIEPQSGSIGTTFEQHGTGFTPNSTASIYFRGPDGTECPPIREVTDSRGQCQHMWTAPATIQIGQHQYRVTDDSTGRASRWFPFNIATTSTRGPPTDSAATATLGGTTLRVANTGGAGLRLRSEPTTSSTVMGTLPDGARLPVIGGPVRADGYLWWRLSGSQGSGWSAVAKWLTPDPTVGSTVEVSDLVGPTGLRLRGSPSLSGAVRCALPAETRLSVQGGPVLADGYSWWLVSASQGIGWCATGNWLIP